MITILQEIIDVIYTPLVTALNELSIFNQEIINGSLVFTLSELIATIITTSFFFFILYAPIYLVYKTLKKVVRF